MYGYAGSILKVDLTRRSFTEVKLDPAVARRWVGGSGLAAYLYLEEIAPVLEAAAEAGAGYPDPLGPENPLIIATGPLTGTRLPAASRWTVAARSPLTGIWGEANVGGFFGAELKFAGFDAVVITGRASRPVYLLIDLADGKRLSLEDGSALWGKDSYESTDLLGDLLGAPRAGRPGRRPQILAIGPAGENLVRFASAVHRKHHVAGRTGMGAVMGSKNLKAVVVRAARSGGGEQSEAGDRSEGLPFPVAQPARLKELAAAFAARARENMVTKSLGEAGTIMGMDLGALIGDVPIRNWSQGAWDDELSKVGVGGYAAYLTGTGTCFACPVACKRKVTVEALGRRLEDAAGAEYETLGCLGPNLLISDLGALLVLGDAANRLGLDTITAGGTLAYAFEAADRGLLDALGDAAEIGRLKDAWGKPELVLELLGDIAHRRGVGDLLAEGSAALARRIGRPEAAGFLSTVKGLEAPAHDPRAVHGMAVAYATSTRGACHMNSLMYGVEHAGASAPEAGLETDGLQQSSAGKGLLNKAAQDLGSVFGQAAVLCQLGGNMYTGDDLVAMLNAVTGFGYTLQEVLECGARIWHTKRGLGNLYGVTSGDDRLPPRLLEPLSEGGAAGSVPDLEGMLAEWYQARGIDPTTGLARREILEGLGLQRLADLLQRRRDAAKAGR